MYSAANGIVYYKHDKALFKSSLSFHGAVVMTTLYRKLHYKRIDFTQSVHKMALLYTITFSISFEYKYCYQMTECSMHARLSTSTLTLGGHIWHIQHFDC